MIPCGHAKLHSEWGYHHCTLPRGHDSLHGDGDFFWMDDQMKAEIDDKLSKRRVSAEEAEQVISMTVTRESRMLVEFEFPVPLEQAPLEDLIKAAHQRGARRGHVTILPVLSFQDARANEGRVQ